MSTTQQIEEGKGLEKTAAAGVPVPAPIQSQSNRQPVSQFGFVPQFSEIPPRPRPAVPLKPIAIDSIGLSRRP
jgi:hypothetical protein